MAPKKILQDMTPSKRSIKNVPIKLALSELDEKGKPEKKTTTRKTVAGVPGVTSPLTREPAMPKPLMVAAKVPPAFTPKAATPAPTFTPRASAPAPKAAVVTPRPASATSKPKAKKSAKRSWVVVTFTVLVICIALIVAAISLLFSKGTVVIKPKTVSVVVGTTQIARLNAVSPQLPYEVITLSDEAHTDVPGVQSATIEKKATGTVILYNSFSSATQKIIAGTRISNTKGLIYKTVSEVVIPGQKAVGGKATPGSIAVKVTAEKAGVEYNSYLADLTGDFKIVAYQGSDKYNKIYARAKTDIVGGYAGKQVTPDKTAQAAAEKSLKEKLAAKLLANSKSLIPKGYVTYDTANKIDYIVLAPSASSQGTGSSSAASASKANVGVKATFVGYVFKTSDLVNAFAKDQIAQFPAEGYNVVDLDKLEFRQIPNSVAITKSATASSTISFSLKGNMKIVGTIPVDKLKKELAGVSVQDSGQIMRKYGTIGGAYAKISPVWMRSLPNDPDRITIEIQSE